MNKEAHSRQQAISNLKPFEFDEFLDTIYDEKIAILIHVTHITGVKPPINIDCCRGGLLVIQVSFHHLAMNQQRDISW